MSPLPRKLQTAQRQSSTKGLTRCENGSWNFVYFETIVRPERKSTQSQTVDLQKVMERSCCRCSHSCTSESDLKQIAADLTKCLLDACPVDLDNGQRDAIQGIVGVRFEQSTPSREGSYTCLEDVDPCRKKSVISCPWNAIRVVIILSLVSPQILRSLRIPPDDT